MIKKIFILKKEKKFKFNQLLYKIFSKNSLLFMHKYKDFSVVIIFDIYIIIYFFSYIVLNYIK